MATARGWGSAAEVAQALVWALAWVQETV